MNPVKTLLIIKSSLFLFSSYLFEIVLPFVRGSLPVLDGFCRAMMIAGKTRQTAPRVEPDRCMSLSSINVLYGTYLAARAALDAFVFSDAKRSVRHQVPHENSSKNVAVDSRPMTFICINNTSLFFDDEGDNFV